jgi:hypothetical protein
MSAGNRGGARKGAGRKNVLTADQRFEVGAAIENLLWQETRAAFARKVAAVDLYGELGQAQKQLLAEYANFPRLNQDAIGAQLDDIETEIEEGPLQGRRVWSGPTTVARGIRDPIIQRVAIEASQKWRVHVSARMAERCLEHYRSACAKDNVQIACDGIMALLAWLGVMVSDV